MNERQKERALELIQVIVADLGARAFIGFDADVFKYLAELREIIKPSLAIGTCPVCGKKYTYRAIYFMNNYTCSSRECKDQYQKDSIKT